MELVKKQIGVPWQTPGAGHRGAHHSSVSFAPAAVARCLWLCMHINHIDTQNNLNPFFSTLSLHMRAFSVCTKMNMHAMTDFFTLESELRVFVHAFEAVKNSRAHV